MHAEPVVLVLDRFRPPLAFAASAIALGLVAAAGGSASAQTAGPTYLRGASQPLPPEPGATAPAMSAPPAPAASAGDKTRGRPTASPARRPVLLPTRGGATGAIRGTVQPDLTASRPPAPAQPVPPRRKRPEVDYFAPLGWRFGGVTVLPAIEADVGYDSNPNRSSGPHRGSPVYRAAGEVRLQSDWSRHALSGALRGSYSAYPDVRGADRPTGEGRVNLRLDALRDTWFDIDGRFVIDTQRPGSPDLPGGVTDRPIVASGGLSTGVSQRFNRLVLGLKGSVDRTIYEDARLANGATLNQSDRNYTQYGLALRAGYEVHPGFQPFVEGTLDTRRHDQFIDSSGYARDSNGVGLRVGTTYEITRKLAAEVAVGYQRRDYDDPRLAPLRGPIVDAAVIWSATPLTTVRLRAATNLDETTVVGASGIVAKRASLELEHALRRYLTLTGTLTFTQNDYQGVYLVEDGLAGSLKLDWKLTRALAVRASFTHERLKSTSPGDDYTANVFLLGLRLQR